MFKISQIIRPLHTSRVWMSDTKSLLASLRKNTGYPLSNCKKALEACDNDLSKAQEWLKEQALALGWAKAYKLSGRSALDGLIAVTSDSKSATIVEINCETDFVSRNEVFKNLAFNVADTCFSWAMNQNQFENSIAKVDLDALQLKSLTDSEGRKLDDAVALTISLLGENIQLRRARCIKVNDELSVAACTHPVTGEKDSVVVGKYGSIIVYKGNPSNENNDLIAKQLCQHIIGMKPTKIGRLHNEEKPKENKDVESCLVHQEFVMDNEVSVSQVLEENEISVVEFTRFKCGEDLEEAVCYVNAEEEPIASAGIV